METAVAITLYDLVDKDGKRYSPYGWRIRMALAHKGLDVAVELCWHSDKKKLSFSGQSLVPVLVDDQQVVSDSWNIACYLDEAYPNRPMLMGGAAPAYVDYILFGTLQMPRCLNGVDPLSPQQDAILRWRGAMRKLFNGLADPSSGVDQPVPASA